MESNDTSPSLSPNPLPLSHPQNEHRNGINSKHKVTPSYPQHNLMNGKTKSFSKAITPTTSSPEDMLTQLRIKVAVLENELQHARKEKDDAMQSSVVIARALAGICASSDGAGNGERITALKKDIERLTEENKVLWARIESQSQRRDSICEGRGDGADVPQCKGKEKEGKGKLEGEKSFDSLIGDEFGVSTFDSSNRPLRNGAPTQKLGGHSQYIESARADQDQDRDDSHSTTELKTPRLLPIQNGREMQIPSDELQDERTVRMNTADVGFFDLEQALSSDANDIDKLFPAAINGLQNNGSKINSSFSSSLFPTPKILKTGFEVKDSFRNEDSSCHHPTRDYNRHSGPPIETPSRADTEVWRSAEERADALSAHMRAAYDRGENRYPDFFRYGIKYRPSAMDSNYKRTVHVRNLPTDVSLKDILARVRGGEIVSAVLCNEVPITGGMAAIVIFLNEEAAAAYVEYTSKNPVTFSSSKKNNAIVTLLPTPTYPFSPTLQRRIYEDHRTRCLAISAFTTYRVPLRTLLEDLARGNAFCAETLVDYFFLSLSSSDRLDQRTLQLQFSSIAAASSAFIVLNNWAVYTEMVASVHFVRDPCAGPLSDLATAAKMMDVEGFGEREKNLGMCSWADEVIEEAERKEWIDRGFKRQPEGLSTSKYADADANDRGGEVKVQVEAETTTKLEEVDMEPKAKNLNSDEISLLEDDEDEEERDMLQRDD